MENLTTETKNTLDRFSNTIKATAKMIIKRTSGTSVIVAAHPSTFKKWWGEMERCRFARSATKYCHAPYRKAGVYVIKTIGLDDTGAMDVICRFA